MLSGYPAAADLRAEGTLHVMGALQAHPTHEAPSWAHRQGHCIKGAIVCPGMEPRSLALREAAVGEFKQG